MKNITKNQIEKYKRLIHHDMGVSFSETEILDLVNKIDDIGILFFNKYKLKTLGKQQ